LLINYGLSFKYYLPEHGPYGMLMAILHFMDCIRKKAIRTNDSIGVQKKDDFLRSLANFCANTAADSILK